MVWNVLYVKSKSEKKVAQRLADKGIEVFCPIKIEKRQWSDRVKKIEVPYFPSYVFAKFSPKQANYVLETPGVVRRLFWLQKPAIIPEKEMQEVMDFFKVHPVIEPIRYSQGELVQITRGLMKDKQGIVLLNKKSQVVLSIPALGCGFKVCLDAKDVIRPTSKYRDKK